MRLNVIELGHSGHQRQHVLNILSGWNKYATKDWRIEISVPKAFLQNHPDVSAAAAGQDRADVRISSLPDEISNALDAAATLEQIPLSWIYPPGPPEPSVERIRWTIAQRCAVESHSSKQLLMHLDQFLVPLAAHCEAASDIYGILHSPPPRTDRMKPGRKLWALHQRAILARALSHPQLRAVFTFDETFMGEMSRSPHAAKLVALPDPVSIPARLSAPDRTIVRRGLGIPDSTTNFFFFGQLAVRKGLIELLDALHCLEQADRSRISLSIAGPVSDIPQHFLEERLSELRGTGMQVLEKFGFISDEDAYELFEAADVVAIPYLEHVGISGVMLRAAAHQRPVLSQSYGLMGEMVRRHSLGITTDPKNRFAIVENLKSILDGGMSQHFDPEKALSLAKHHNSADYQQRIYERLSATV